MRLRFFNAYDTAAPFFRSLIPYLLSKGEHQIEVVVSKAKYRGGDGFERDVSSLKDVTVIRAVNFGLNASNIIKKMIIMLSYIIHACAYSLIGRPVDCNIFLTQPPLLSLLGFVLSKVRGQPYFCVVMDMYPDLAVELGVLSRSSRWTKFLGKLSAFTLQNAHGVVVIGRCMAEKIKSLGVIDQNIKFIPNWADEQKIYPVKHSDNSFRKKLRWMNKFVVLYAGNIGVPQHFADILSVAKSLQENRYSKIIFVFIGGGSRYKNIEDRSHYLDNIIVMPFQHDIYPLSEILCAGDLHLVTLKEEITGLAVPSKAYSTLAAGRPILYQGGQNSEVARMINEEDIGTVIRCGDVEGLKRSILRYANEPELCNSQGSKACSLAKGIYSREKCLTQYEAFFFKNLPRIHLRKPLFKQIEFRSNL